MFKTFAKAVHISIVWFHKYFLTQLFLSTKKPPLGRSFYIRLCVFSCAVKLECGVTCMEEVLQTVAERELRP